jgi:putative spermidine/putrescine transport system substrate-binding protein
MDPRTRRGVALGAGIALALAMIPGGAMAQEPVPEGAMTELGEPEGVVEVLAWPYYVEDGSNDPNADWVTGFEEETGCDVVVTIADSSDQMFTLMQAGNHDLVSASGDASNRLMAAGAVAPINVNLIPNYVDVFEGLKLKPHNSIDGVPYGVPHGRGANLLLFNTEQVTPEPDSWSIVWDPASPWAETVASTKKVTAYGFPIYIADAAVYLMSTRPELGITNPYALDETQFEAALELLRTQRGMIDRYWGSLQDEISGFQSGDFLVGTTWQVTANMLAAADPPTPVKAILPKEGSTGWSDTWMLSSQAKNPNCAYLFMNHIISPEANAKATEYFGEAPANAKACEIASPGHCDTYHATDEEYFSKVYYWATPQAECLDGRKDVTCKDFSEWTAAWTEIQG